MKSRLAVYVLVLMLLGRCVFAQDEPAKNAAPPDFASAVVLAAVGFLPDDLKAQFSAVGTQIISAARPKVEEPDKFFGFAEKNDEAARKLFAAQYEKLRKAVESGKSAADLKAELGIIGWQVIAVCDPYRADKASFESEARPAFTKKLDALASTLKCTRGTFARVTDPDRFALEMSAKARTELKSLLADEKKGKDAPSAVFTRASNSLADVWQSLFTKAEVGDFIGNKSSKKFHRATCRHLPAEKNRVQFKSRDEAIEAGYDPCKVCKP
ncbi:MAG: hypothetical protein KBC96_09425 [Armatimonadetes bacterium]|nr:hypothetical protein [Armatimonadota bacterium]